MCVLQFIFMKEKVWRVLNMPVCSACTTGKTRGRCLLFMHSEYREADKAPSNSSSYKADLYLHL